MRIALIHYSFWPVVGGVETILREHARLFCAAGHDVSVFCNRGSAPPDGPQEQHKEVEFASPKATRRGRLRVESIAAVGGSPGDLSQSGSLPSDFESRREALREVLGPALSGHDIVSLHNVCTMPFDLALTAAAWDLADTLPQTRFVAWIHDLAAANPDYQIPNAAPWDLLRRAHPRMEYVAVSELRRRQFLELTGGSPDACTVVPNGIDPVQELCLTAGVKEIVYSFNLFARDLVLFHPARLLRRKNVEASLHITAALRAQGCDAALLLTGAADPHHAASAEYAASLRSTRDQLQLQDDAVFLGDLLQIGPEEMRDLLAVSDALIFPSRQEGFGLPMLEAAIHRLPAFCSDIEPLNSLPGAEPFSLDAPPDEIASMIRRQTVASPTIRARKSALRMYSWSAIWQIFLAPFLTETNTALHP